MDRAESTKRRILRKRDQWRGRECRGCRHDYYNWPTSASERGDVEVPADKYCWSLPEAKRIRGLQMARCNTSKPVDHAIVRCGRLISIPKSGSGRPYSWTRVCGDCERALGRPLDYGPTSKDRMIGKHVWCA